MLIFLYIALLRKRFHKQKSIDQWFFVYFSFLMRLEKAPGTGKCASAAGYVPGTVSVSAAFSSGPRRAVRTLNNRTEARTIAAPTSEGHVSVSP